MESGEKNKRILIFACGASSFAPVEEETVKEEKKKQNGLAPHSCSLRSGRSSGFRTAGKHPDPTIWTLAKVLTFQTVCRRRQPFADGPSECVTQPAGCKTKKKDIIIDVVGNVQSSEN